MMSGFRMADPTVVDRRNQLSSEVLYGLVETWAELEDHILLLSHLQ